MDAAWCSAWGTTPRPYQQSAQEGTAECRQLRHGAQPAPWCSGARQRGAPWGCAGVDGRGVPPP
eukprot:9379724-Lingulodinium_polyedra.AAC.1